MWSDADTYLPRLVFSEGRLVVEEVEATDDGHGHEGNVHHEGPVQLISACRRTPVYVPSSANEINMLIL